MLTPSSRGVLLLVAGLLPATGCRLAPETSAAKKAAADDLASAVNLTEREQHSRARAHAHFGSGVIHEMNGDNEAALAEYVQAAREDVDNEELLLDVCRRLLVLKRMDEALNLLEAAAKRPGMSEQVFVRLGVVYAQKGREAQAVAACEKAIHHAPHSIIGYQALFVAYLQALKQDQAFRVLERASEQAGAPPEFYITLADLYSKFSTQVPNRREVARSGGLSALRKAEATVPGSAMTPSVALALADAYNTLGDQEKAAEMYQRVLQALPNAPGIRGRIQARLTEIYLRKDDRERAVGHLQEIVKQDPTSPQAWYLLGAIAFEDKKYSEAEEFYRKALLLNPEAEQVHYDLASTLINLGKTSEALSLLQTARGKFEAGFPLEFLTGMAFSRQQGFAEAMRHFVAAEVIARATDPSRLNEFFFFQLGATCERKGDFEQAEKYLKLALEKAPDFAEAQNYLGYMWADRGENLDEALALIEKAVSAEPDNAAFLDSLGWVLFKKGRHQEALQRITRAIEISEEADATLYDHLGDIHAALGQREKAVEAWEKSVAIEPDEKVRNKISGTPR